MHLYSARLSLIVPLVRRFLLQGMRMFNKFRRCLAFEFHMSLRFS